MQLTGTISQSNKGAVSMENIDIARRGYSGFLKIIHFAGDLLLLNVCFFGAYLLRFGDIPKHSEIASHYISLHVIFNLTWIVTVTSLNLYNIKRISSLEVIIWGILKSGMVHAACMICFLFAIKNEGYSRQFMLIFYGLFIVSISVWRISFWQFLKKYRSSGRNYRNVVIVGAEQAGQKLLHFLNFNPHLGYKFLGFFDNTISNEGILGKVEDVSEYIKTRQVDEIYCTLPLTNTDAIRELMITADNNMVRFKMVPDFQGLMHKKVVLDFYDDVPVMMLRPEPLELTTNRVVKRIFDIVFSLLVIVLIMPIALPVIALLIKISSRGPVIFSQKRSGLNNCEFNCYKFRTMVVNDNAHQKQATKDDDRITTIGKFLRKSSLDELPQFFNVLMGDMSVVGPRPHMIKHTEEYSRIVNQYMVRQFAKPGITGWAQVNGLRGNTSDPAFMSERVKYDVWYIENYTFLKDIKIIFLTIISIVKGDKNAH
ncbi:MAG: undecaprenyl-phosphate glucose phosphotransferase [Flavobacteriales bacterium]